MMNCNSEIHNEFKNMEQFVCPFSLEKYQEHIIKSEPSFENENLTIMNKQYFGQCRSQVERYYIDLAKPKSGALVSLFSSPQL